ncbi:histidine phosphatase family protein [Quadrisphaera setariae]|uniref:MSMEG_4193 family putative phosphomutase n=1 Tax=Quadrisphaera setariae TaxID=2593304 RepID=A0A5C8ZFI7_9ACTN|nr:histidine phosphatase family protein [Quadrisphaera setariae]TXR56622.1 MSMEG_4193 family putative phosphomutase [Quadrisphaera setariae]
MPVLLLVRHGRTAANTGGVLAGRTPGVTLDETGRAQVAALAQRLAPLPLVRVVASPLERCQETAAALLAVPGPDGAPRPELVTDEGLSECDYGDWTGRPIAELLKEPLWGAVQAHPSSVVFPGGEPMRMVQQRALDVVRRIDAEVAAEHGPDAVWAAVSHGDVIKAVLADALGVHLDGFQRIVVDPASVSVVRYTPLRPFAVRTNDTGGDVTSLLPPPPEPSQQGEPDGDQPDQPPSVPSSDAVIGGGAGGGR